MSDRPQSRRIAWEIPQHGRSKAHAYEWPDHEDPRSLCGRPYPHLVEMDDVILGMLAPSQVCGKCLKLAGAIPIAK